ncbi:hypothetical protein [Mucilaginibacter gynuensis]
MMSCEDLFQLENAFALLVNPETTPGKADPVQSMASAASSMFRSWERSLLSNASEQSLKRYFSLHLECVAHLLQILDTVYKDPSSNSLRHVHYTETSQILLSIIDELLKRHRGYFNCRIQAPNIWQEKWIGSHTDLLDSVINSEFRTLAGANLSEILYVYCSDLLSSTISYHNLFHSFIYTLNLLQALQSLHTSGRLNPESLAEKLLYLDFNYLPYAVGLQDQMLHKAGELRDKTEQLAYFEQQKRLVSLQQNTDGLKCQTRWPSLSTMLGGWLDEQINKLESKLFQEEINLPVAGKKVLLQLPVAQIAFFARLFVDGKLLNGLSLTELFDFISKNFSSKKQSVISPGSLSKEYYSPEQVTAGRVRGFLLDMVAYINRHFFPLLAAGIVLNHF